MFTGIVEEVGKVSSVRFSGNSGTLAIEAREILAGTKIGDSISVNGVCLTVTEMKGAAFTADVMAETYRRSSLKEVRTNGEVNLERAMKADGRFGGHIVSGHIDDCGTVEKIVREENAVWFFIKASKNILRLVVEKGSIAIDGISLTVASVSENNFSVSIIPHTLSNTALRNKKIGSTVNLETDIIGKYVEKLMSERNGKITKAFLFENGF